MFLLSLIHIFGEMGPAVLIAFAIVGVIVYGLMIAYAELLVNLPRKGSFVAYTNESVSYTHLIDKTLKAAEKQLSWIRKIQETKGLAFLPDKLREVAVLRLENPEATLQELADMMDPPMKKSGLNNRFRKIEELAGKL